MMSDPQISKAIVSLLIRIRQPGGHGTAAAAGQSLPSRQTETSTPAASRVRVFRVTVTVGPSRALRLPGSTSARTARPPAAANSRSPVRPLSPPPGPHSLTYPGRCGAWRTVTRKDWDRLGAVLDLSRCEPGGSVQPGPRSRPGLQGCFKLA